LPLPKPCVHSHRGTGLHARNIGRVDRKGDVDVGMAGSLADDLDVHAVHQKVADMGMAQPMQSDPRHLDSDNQASERLGYRVRVQWLAIGAGKDEPRRVTAESKLQPLPGLRCAIFLQCLYDDSGQSDRASTRFRFRRFECDLALDALERLVDGDVRSLEWRSDQRKPSNSPRRSPVVTATRTGR